jgi:alpha-mannosidase
MENEHVSVVVEPNGTVSIFDKSTKKAYEDLNYLTDQGECGNAWKHAAPQSDGKLNTLGVHARIGIVESGPLVSTIAAEYDFTVPVESDTLARSPHTVDLPVRAEYRLEKGSPALKVTVCVRNDARDHWLRANFPTGIDTDVTWADSHFDVLSRPIAVPDSIGWVEQAFGTHPLRTFVDMTDGTNGLALLTKGLFEYEAFEDRQNTLALTLLRACKIKLEGSEKKQELPDMGIQCPGAQRFEYAICVHEGDWKRAALLSKAACFYAPVRAAMTGRGKGDLPEEAGLFAIDNLNIHVTAVKQAEDGSGLIVRFFNADCSQQKVTLTFGKDIPRAALCKMDESEVEDMRVAGTVVDCVVAPKKIRTVKVVL